MDPWLETKIPHGVGQLSPYTITDSLMLQLRPDAAKINKNKINNKK